MSIEKKKEETKFVESVEQSMKSGYISMLILLALEKEPANGYKLMKMISEDTFGEWRPTNSTMYPYLSNLTKRGLIQYRTKKQGQRESKEYSLTPKGTKILKKLVNKQQEMNLSLLSMVSTVIDISSLPNHLLDFFNQSYHEYILRGKSSEEKIGILSRRVEMLNLFLDIMGKHKVEMENELEILKSNEMKK
ncbi:MAG: PadR family transcriptional regulator [Candidatus Lokiarchaeota archaeon]|nr:PadR family transcriptional regulator [Candidatus Lokiarchaeota archaeon]